MNSKQIIGLILIVLGVVAILFASYARIRVNEVRDSISHENSIIPDNPIGKTIDKSLQSQVSKYDTKILLGFVGGSIVVVVGAGMMICCRRKK